MKNKKNQRIDWGHLTLLVLVLGWTIWYFIDTRGVSQDIQNLLVLTPVVILTLALGSIAVFQSFVAHKLPEKLQPEKLTRSEFGKIAVLIVSFLAFVAMLPILGFDGSGALYIALSMSLFGERRPIVLITFPIVSMLVLTLLFKALVPYDIPTVFSLLN
jgi:hypothetical protein